MESVRSWVSPCRQATARAPRLVWGVVGAYQVQPMTQPIVLMLDRQADTWRRPNLQLAGPQIQIHWTCLSRLAQSPHTLEVKKQPRSQERPGDRADLLRFCGRQLTEASRCEALAALRHLLVADLGQSSRRCPPQAPSGPSNGLAEQGMTQVRGHQGGVDSRGRLLRSPRQV